MKTGELVKKYLQDYADLPNLTLAKKIKKDYPDLATLDAIRSAIRYYKHQKGNDGRIRISTDLYKQEPGESAITQNIGNPYTNTEKVRKSPAKILILDIETAPIRAFVWSLWKQNVSTKQIISDWFCISWSAKWLFEDHVMSDVLKPKEIRKQNDKRIIKSMWALINEADILIAHNGDKFDLRRLRTRFLFHGLHSPSPYLTIDTLKHARNQFAISSNRLDYLGEFLEVGRKIDTGGFELWERCMEGDAEALRTMQEYCDQDVLLLERVYLKMRPWIKPHPNIGLYIEEDVNACPSCGSDDLRLKGDYYTTVNKYEALQCGNCGAWSRSRTTSTPLKDNRGVKSSLPR